jgi:hypothetical protein
MPLNPSDVSALIQSVEQLSADALMDLLDRRAEEEKILRSLLAIARRRERAERQRLRAEEEVAIA